jgi:hypothetical protein
VLYSDHVVRCSYAYRAGELNDRAVSQIVASVPKILAVQ